MEIKYEDFQEIVMCLGIAADIANAAGFEFEDDEERQTHYEELERVETALRKAEQLI